MIVHVLHSSQLYPLAYRQYYEFYQLICMSYASPHEQPTDISYKRRILLKIAKNHQTFTIALLFYAQLCVTIAICTI